jgi:hypothetical protein
MTRIDTAMLAFLTGIALMACSQEPPRQVVYQYVPIPYASNSGGSGHIDTHDAAWIIALDR